MAGPVDMESVSLTATLQQKIKLTPVVLLIQFKLEGDQKIKFRAGQYITVNIPVGNETVERSFSIASSPADQDQIELLVRLMNGGIASNFFEKLNIGETVRLEGPKGNFQITDYERPIKFIASSTGLAPFRSMIYDLLEIKKSAVPINLVFIAPSEEEVFLTTELNDFSKTHQNFSHALALDLASYLSQFSIANNDEDIYLCGGPNFIKDLVTMLTKKGAAENRIHYEKFE